MAYPPELNSLFAFTYKQYFIKEVGKGQDTHKFTNPDIYDPIREFQRVGLPGAGFRITNANQDYKLCPTYPSFLVVPEGITDDQLKSVAGFRSRGLYCLYFALRTTTAHVLSQGRIPAVVWRHPVHGSTISRLQVRKSSQAQIPKMLEISSVTTQQNSQPSVGLKGNTCTEDILLLSQLRNTNQQGKASSKTTHQRNFLMKRHIALYVLDSRPKTNALANSLKGGGYEKNSHYKVWFSSYSMYRADQCCFLFQGLPFGGVSECRKHSCS